MFQFPSFASYTYVFSARYPPYDGWVSPFRDLRIKGCVPPPRSLSQAPTSFIASNCQGIHRMRLFAWPYIKTYWLLENSLSNHVQHNTNTPVLLRMLPASYSLVVTTFAHSSTGVLIEWLCLALDMMCDTLNQHCRIVWFKIDKQITRAKIFVQQFTTS